MGVGVVEAVVHFGFQRVCGTVAGVDKHIHKRLSAQIIHVVVANGGGDPDGGEQVIVNLEKSLFEIGIAGAGIGIVASMEDEVGLDLLQPFDHAVAPQVFFAAVADGGKAKGGGAGWFAAANGGDAVGGEVFAVGEDAVLIEGVGCQVGEGGFVDVVGIVGGGIGGGEQGGGGNGRFPQTPHPVGHIAFPSLGRCPDDGQCRGLQVLHIWLPQQHGRVGVGTLIQKPREQ